MPVAGYTPLINGLLKECSTSINIEHNQDACHWSYPLNQRSALKYVRLVLTLNITKMPVTGHTPLINGLLKECSTCTNIEHNQDACHRSYPSN